MKRDNRLAPGRDSAATEWIQIRVTADEKAALAAAAKRDGARGLGPWLLGLGRKRSARQR